MKKIDDDFQHGRVQKPRHTLRELYGRICFNVLCGNTDDHARNHAAFWDGKMLTLTPAYDICPQGRTGNEATQAMLIKGDRRTRYAEQRARLTTSQASTGASPTLAGRLQPIAAIADWRARRALWMAFLAVGLDIQRVEVSYGPNPWPLNQSPMAARTNKVTTPAKSSQSAR